MNSKIEEVSRDKRTRRNLKASLEQKEGKRENPRKWRKKGEGGKKRKKIIETKGSSRKSLSRKTSRYKREGKITSVC